MACKLEHGHLAQARFTNMLEPGMKINVPDERLGNMARFALVRDMMTRVGDSPKYGAFDKDYRPGEHDGFPDTFTVDTAAMLDWGLIELAGQWCARSSRMAERGAFPEKSDGQEGSAIPGWWVTLISAGRSSGVEFGHTLGHENSSLNSE